MNIPTPKYKIGNKVYHITPDSDMGIILDAQYSLLDGRWWYIVTFGIKDNDHTYYEQEITPFKVF